MDHTTANPRTERAQRDSGVHLLSLGAVWLTMALSAVVLFEPAPVDAMLMGLMILLPAVGLARFDRVTGAYTIAWLIICAGGFVSAIWAVNLRQANMHIIVTFYLAMASVVLAAFVRTDPQRHLRVIENGLLFAGAVAALTGLVGIFRLVPGASVFVVHDRATGTFEDPNVMGAFMVVPIMIALQRAVEATTLRRLCYVALMLGMTLALILSLSRGAYLNLLVAVIVYFYLRFISVRALADRLHLVLFVCAGIAVAILIGVAALSFDRIGELMASRMGTQAYDVGEQGRFAGQRLALTVIAEHPFGIGPLQFESFHREVPHQVYLSMFLHSGWLGGFAFIAVCVATLFYACRHALRETPVQSTLLVFAGCWAGLVVESLIIDTDHWRHLFVVLAIIWGILASHHYRRSALGQPVRSVLSRSRPSLRAQLATAALALSLPGMAPNARSAASLQPRQRVSLRQTQRQAA